MSQPIGPVQSLTTGADGNLWVLLQSTKVLRYREGSFHFGRDEAEIGITALGRGTDGSVLLSSLAYGILAYQDGKFKILQSPPRESQSPSNSAENNTNDTLSSRLAWASSIAAHRLAEPESPVRSIAQTDDGRIWLGTRDKGLFCFLDGRLSPIEKSRLKGKITGLLPWNGGKLWLATDTGLAELQGSQLSQSDVPSVLQKAKVLAMLRDRDSNVWLGTSNGLVRLNKHGVASLPSGAGTSGGVTALFEDREGNIWTGSARGIERFRDGAFITYPAGGGQSESSGPIYVDPEGRVWFAPLGGGLYWLKDDKQVMVTNDGLKQDVIYSIAGSKHDLWVGRQRGGLTHLRYTKDFLVTKTYTEKDGLPQNGVFAVKQSRDGAIWAATLSGGVSKFSDGHFVTYLAEKGLSSDLVTSIEETPDGTLWFATPNGLNALSNGQWRVLHVRDGLPSEDIHCLFGDSAGVLWIGTASGLAYFRAGHVASATQEPVPFQEAIYGIAQSKNDLLWMTSSNHVFSVRREKLLDGMLTHADIREYGVEDGLAGTEGVKRDRSVFADSRGRIWLSTNRGLSVMDPTRSITDSAAAIVRIEQLSIDGNPVDLKRLLPVPPGSHRVAFTFSSVSLSVPERVRFKYMLERFDQHWSEPVSAHEATYTNLDSGKYRFRVMASNSEGLWNSAESSLPIEVLPVFWKTWWFRLSSLLVIGLVLLTYLRLRVMSLTRQMNMRFDERLAERTRIARELHDSLLQGFQGLMFRLQAARNLLPDRPAEAAKELDSVMDRGDEVIAEGRSTVEDLRDSSLRDTDLVEALTVFGRELAGSGNGPGAAPLRVLVEGNSRELEPMARDEIYQIAREALRNAFQHAHARNIEVEVAYGDTEFSLRIRDDGNGIDPTVLHDGRRAGHWGLPGMRERAAGLGGHLRVWTESGAGTEIDLTLPASLAYGARSPATRFSFLKIFLRSYGRR